jgi:hypothetical protein
MTVTRFDQLGGLLLALACGFSAGVAAADWEWFPTEDWGDIAHVLPTGLNYVALLLPWVALLVFVGTRRYLKRRETSIGVPEEQSVRCPPSSFRVPAPATRRCAVSESHDNGCDCNDFGRVGGRYRLGGPVHLTSAASSMAANRVCVEAPGSVTRCLPRPPKAVPAPLLNP